MSVWFPKCLTASTTQKWLNFNSNKTECPWVQGSSLNISEGVYETGQWYTLLYCHCPENASCSQITMATDVLTSKVGFYCNGETWIAISFWEQSGVFNNLFPVVSSRWSLRIIEWNFLVRQGLRNSAGPCHGDWLGPATSSFCSGFHLSSVLTWHSAVRWGCWACPARLL